MYTYLVAFKPLPLGPGAMPDPSEYVSLQAHSMINLVGDLARWGVEYTNIYATSEAQGAAPVDTFDHASLIPLLLNMKDRGGGFHSALATAWLRADLTNSRRLFREFESDLRRYADH